MSQKQPKNVVRNIPSTKARQRSYVALQFLVKVLDALEIAHPFYGGKNEGHPIDYKGWKRWANTHTPPNKRGGPSEH